MTVRDRFVDAVATSVKAKIYNLPDDLNDARIDDHVAGIRAGVEAVLDVLFHPSKEDGFKVVEVDLVPKINDEYISKYAHDGDRGYRPEIFEKGYKPAISPSMIESIWNEVSS